MAESLAVQAEKPSIGIAELERRMGLQLGSGTLVSGGQFENFRRGWAHTIQHDSRKAHWFERQGFRHAFALCGLDSTIPAVYGPGNYPRCQRCIVQMTRAVREGRWKKPD